MNKQLKAVMPSLFAVIGAVVGLLVSYLIRPVKYLGFSEWFDYGLKHSDTAPTIYVCIGIGFLLGWVLDMLYEQFSDRQNPGD